MTRDPSSHPRPDPRRVRPRRVRQGEMAGEPPVRRRQERAPYRRAPSQGHRHGVYDPSGGWAAGPAASAPTWRSPLESKSRPWGVIGANRSRTGAPRCRRRLVVAAVCHCAQSVAKPDHSHFLGRRRVGFDLARRLVIHCWCGVDCVWLWCRRPLVELGAKRIDLLQQHQDRPAHRPLLPISNVRQCNRPLPQLPLLCDCRERRG